MAKCGIGRGVASLGWSHRSNGRDVGKCKGEEKAKEDEEVEGGTVARASHCFVTFLWIWMRDGDVKGGPYIEELFVS